jgi:general secretion pathway protein B
MSYILEALRRADAERERERGAVPGLHAQPLSPESDDDAPPPRQSRALLWAVVVLSLALAGSLAWHLMGAESPRVVAEASPSAAVSPPLVAPVSAPPAPVAPATSLAAQVQQPVQPVPTPAPPARAMPPVQRAAPPAVVAERPPASPARLPPPAPMPAPEASADTRVYNPNELPDDVRRDLPKLVVGGAMYSDSPANRMLIINSQIFHEGDKLTPDLLLQEIKLKSAVFKYKGYRYAVNY